MMGAIKCIINKKCVFSSYNTVRQHMPTLFALALGIGQKVPQTNETAHLLYPEKEPFCVLFQSQEVFKSDVKCSQENVSSKILLEMAIFKTKKSKIIRCLLKYQQR